MLARAELHRCWSASSRPPFVRVRTRLLVRLLLSCSFASMAVSLRLQGYPDGVEAPAGGPRAAGHGEGDGPRQARHGHTQARSPGAFFLFFFFSSPLCFPDMSTLPTLMAEGQGRTDGTSVVSKIVGYQTTARLALSGEAPTTLIEPYVCFLWRPDATWQLFDRDGLGPGW